MVLQKPVLVCQVHSAPLKQSLCVVWSSFVLNLQHRAFISRNGGTPGYGPLISVWKLQLSVVFRGVPKSENCDEKSVHPASLQIYQLSPHARVDADGNFFRHVHRNHSLNAAGNGTKQIFLLPQWANVFTQECVGWSGRVLFNYLYSM